MQAVCPHCGLTRWQEDDDGPYCVTCHEPVTLIYGRFLLGADMPVDGDPLLLIITGEPVREGMQL